MGSLVWKPAKAGTFYTDISTNWPLQTLTFPLLYCCQCQCTIVPVPHHSRLFKNIAENYIGTIVVYLISKSGREMFEMLVKYQIDTCAVHLMYHRWVVH